LEYQIAGRRTVLEEGNTEMCVKEGEQYEVCGLDCTDSWWIKKMGTVIVLDA
jgi:hypothetical protein